MVAAIEQRILLCAHGHRKWLQLFPTVGVLLKCAIGRIRLLELRVVGCEQFAQLGTSLRRENRLRSHGPSNTDTQFLLLLPLLPGGHGTLVLLWQEQLLFLPEWH
jgi:hypothetical protein